LLTVGFIIRDVLGNAMFGTNSTHLGKQLRDVREDDEFAVEFAIRNLDLGTGSYTISVAAHADVTHLSGNYDWWDNALAFQVVPGNRPHSIGVVSLDCACTVTGGRRVLPSALPTSGSAAPGRAPSRP
jgi:lipopolysaccharide transport system ATP-binding protein